MTKLKASTTDMIARIPKMSPQHRRTLLKNANIKLAHEPENTDALAMKIALEVETQPARSDAGRAKLIRWEKSPHSTIASTGYVHDQMVAYVKKQKNHAPSQADNDIYTVVVLEKTLPRQYREIKEARADAEEQYMRESNA